MIDVEDFLKREGIAFKNKINLSYYTYCKVGGSCNLFITPSDKKQMALLITYLNQLGTKYIIIGETSNMLFLDDVVYGIIISTKLLDSIAINGNKVTVGAGVNLSNFLRLLYSKKIYGFDGLEGIPGSVGGAVFMNAGAYGAETAEYISSVECLTLDGTLISLNKEECQFTQRDSIFRKEKKYIILNVTFSTQVSDSENYYKNIEGLHIARHSYQEFVLPNIGSVFTAKRCIYEELCNIDWKYKVAYKLLMKIFYNRLVKLLNRKSPNREIINRFTVKYFGLEEIAEHFSIKHINMFANMNKNSWDLIDYISKMKSILGDKVILENEIVTDSIIEQVNDKYKNYKSIINSVRG
ncbi:UDP-N-acetylmuramate dehydrogenase [Photobacterium swingsii]|uniref:UDP-N-acetylmuramate dehydrogenase n=1 Tax=Photobacterium swingsii TaxID=680026 RepID=UPI004068BFFD